MAYACSSDCTEMYLVTSKKTLKYRNISKNPVVSLMVDTREKNARQDVRALTISGRAIEIHDLAKLSTIRNEMRTRHGHLAGLIDQPDVAWICVYIEAFQLLNGVHTSHHVRLSSDRER
jgi:general stress protein 26